MIKWLIILLLVVFIMRRILPTKGVTNLSVQQAKEKLNDKQVQFIDVRTPGEYKANHQAKFKNIPLGDLPRKTDQLDKNKEVVVICQSGMRSARAATMLKKQGFEKIYNVQGGMSAWR